MSFKVGDRVIIRLPAIEQLKKETSSIYIDTTNSGAIHISMYQLDRTEQLITKCNRDCYYIRESALYWKEEWLVPYESRERTSFYGMLKQLINE